MKNIVINLLARIQKKGELSREWFLENLREPSNEKFYNIYVSLLYVEPTELFSLIKDQEIKLDFGNESLYIYYPGESHSPDNLVVYYPNKKVLFGGCMVKDHKTTKLGNVSDANLNEWEKSIKKLKEKYNNENVTFLIPGHGEIGDIQLLDKTYELLK